MEENRLKCWVGVKVFGNEVSVFTCDDIYHQTDQVSLSMAGLAVKLLKVKIEVNMCIAVWDSYSYFFLCLPLITLLLHTSFIFVLQGHEVQLSHRAVLMTDDLVLPSLSGLPIKLSINMTSLLSLHLKGNINYRDSSHFSLNGYIKPKYFFVSKCNSGNSFSFWGQSVSCNVGVTECNWCLCS